MLVSGTSYPYKQLLLPDTKTSTKACEIPEPVHSSFSGKQEVVPLSFEEPAVCPSSVQLKTDTIPDSVIKITYHSFQIEITNAADRETIFHTLSALQDLC